MRNFSRFIPGEEIGSVEQWNFGAVDSVAVAKAAQIKASEDASDQQRSDALRQAGYTQGYAEGYAEGFAQAQAQGVLEAQRQISEFIAHQGQEAAENFTQLFASARSELAQAEQVMSREVLELACELARQMVRHELSVNPNALQPVVREAMSLLVSETKTALVRLNPLDFDVLEADLRAEFAGLSLTLLADATVARGGCLVESAGTVVDGTLEKRWGRAIANLGLVSPWEDSPNEQ